MPRLSAPLLALALAVVPACSRAEEPAEPVRASPLPPATSSAKGAASVPIPTDTSALPRPSREPDWGLDPDDAAKDYVTRYIRATHRYGDQTGCVEVGPSTFADGQSVVEVKNPASGACGGAGELRDRFFVKVATDTLSVDESTHPAKLARWPDGSEPDGPPAKVTDIQDLHTWQAELRDTFHRLQLAPLRVQLYGRGTYPVVSIAGWHGAVQRAMTPTELAPAARALCAANEGAPLGVFAGLDRTTLFRVQCGGKGAPSGRFESL